MLLQYEHDEIIDIKSCMRYSLLNADSNNVSYKRLRSKEIHKSIKLNSGKSLHLNRINIFAVTGIESVLLSIIYEKSFIYKFNY